MDLEGSYMFKAPRDVVWQALFDPNVLANVLPGCEKLEQVGDNQYEGRLNIKVGPVQGKFKGLVTLSDVNEPESYTMTVDGKGAPGFMKGEGQVVLQDKGETTLMHYDGSAQVGGKLASVGQRLLDSSAKALTRQSLEGLHEQIKARVQAETQPQAAAAPADGSTNGVSAPPAEPASTVQAPSQTEFMLGVAKNMVDDLVPEAQRPKLLAAGLGAFILWLFLKWWGKSIGRQAAREVLRRQHR